MFLNLQLTNILDDVRIIEKFKNIVFFYKKKCIWFIKFEREKNGKSYILKY